MVRLKGWRVISLIVGYGVIFLEYASVKGQEPDLINKVEGLQHSGAVHFYLNPGIIEIELFKDDKEGRYNEVNQIMRAFLVGPDGTTHDTAKLRGTAKKRLRVNVIYEGIYTLFVSVNRDQYIQSVVWGFRTNANAYMINSGAGHTDQIRQEPIVLDGADKTFGVFFKPVRSVFEINVVGEGDSTAFIELYDGKGVLQQRAAYTKNAVMRVNVEPNQAHEVWELRLPRQKGKILIEGITHGWDKGDIPLPVWTTARNHYFDVGNYHWLIGPRRFARSIKTGDSGKIAFKLYNNSMEDMPIKLDLRDIPLVGSYSLGVDQIIIKPKSTKEIDVYYEFPRGEVPKHSRFQLGVTDMRSGHQAYSLIELRVDSAKPITLPIELKLFEHDQFQFAYEPDYPTDNQFYFDVDNRPWVITRDGLKVLKNDHWETVRFPVHESSVYTYPISTLGTDKNGYVYTVIHIDNIPHLMRVASFDLKPQIVRLPPGGKYKVETYMGGKESDHLPVILRYERNRNGSVARWARKHTLELFIPTDVSDTLSISQPILISNNCVGTSDHSGITNSVATDGDKVHIVWGEVSNPEKKEKGVPTYTRSYDRLADTLSSTTLLAYAAPVNDVHNMSSLLVDIEGNHHAVIGAHGRPFQYVTRPVSEETWTSPITWSEVGQTYVGAVLDKRNGIHLLSRIWRHPTKYLDVFDASLSYQYMNKDRVWVKPLPFVIPPLPGYSVFYHRVTVDRLGTLYVSLDYWSTWSPYRESHAKQKYLSVRQPNRVVFVSANGKDFEILNGEYFKNRIQTKNEYEK